jgi:hypothetical protein
MFLFQILVKKSDPDASSLDVEKLVATKKDKLDDILRELMDANKRDEAFKTPESGSSSHMTNPTVSRPVEGKQSLNISRPVMVKPKQDGPPLTLLRPTGSRPRQDEPSLTQLRPGGNSSNEDTSSLTFSRPVGSIPKAQGKVVQDWPSKQSLAAATESSEAGSISRTRNVDLTLRKPTVHQSEDDDLKSKLKMKPNVDLKMRKDMNEDLTIISLLQRPDLAKDTARTDLDHASPNSASTSAVAHNGELEPETNAGVQCPQVQQIMSNPVTEGVHESSGRGDDSIAGKDDTRKL